MIDFSNILLASDYDRTMTAHSGEVPPENLAATERFMELGGRFTIATGRSRPMMAPQLRKVKINAPVILFNGAAVWEPDSGRVTVRHPMPEGWMEAVRTIREQFPNLRLEMQGLRQHSCMGYDALRDEYLMRNGVKGCYCNWEDVDDTVLSVSFYAPFRSAGHSSLAETSPEEERPFDEIAAMVAERYGDLFGTLRSMPRMIELAPKGCGKGTTARWLAGALGCSVLYCAGDAPNDLQMLQEADEGFIPANAFPSLRDCGFTEVASCDDGAIADLVARLECR